MRFLTNRDGLKFSGLACILFAENQLIRELLSSSKAEITFSKVLSDFVLVNSQFIIHSLCQILAIVL
jgi:hypothetical protein